MWIVNGHPIYLTDKTRDRVASFVMQDALVASLLYNGISGRFCHLHKGPWRSVKARESSAESSDRFDEIAIGLMICRQSAINSGVIALICETNLRELFCNRWKLFSVMVNIGWLFHEIVLLSGVFARKMPRTASAIELAFKLNGRNLNCRLPIQTTCKSTARWSWSSRTTQQ